MNVKIADVMARSVIVAQPHHTVAHVRNLLQRNRINAVPVVGPDREAVGIVSSADVARRLKDETPIRRIMTDVVTTVPAYNDVSAAARAMRKRKIHHLVVTHEKRVVGMISAFDLLKLVEGHRFTAKPGPTNAKKSRT